MDRFYADDDEHHSDKSNASNMTTPRNVAINLTGGQVPTGPPTPPMTPDIPSMTNNLENMALSKLAPDKTGVTTELTEVPEHLMTSFFWLQDKFEVWAKSDFGGSLVGFFTRVKMQVRLSLTPVDQSLILRIIADPGTNCFILIRVCTLKLFPAWKTRWRSRIEDRVSDYTYYAETESDNTCSGYTFEVASQSSGTELGTIKGIDLLSGQNSACETDTHGVEKAAETYRRKRPPFRLGNRPSWED